MADSFSSTVTWLQNLLTVFFIMCTHISLAVFDLWWVGHFFFLAQSFLVSDGLISPSARHCNPHLARLPQSLPPGSLRAELFALLARVSICIYRLFAEQLTAVWLLLGL